MSWYTHPNWLVWRSYAANETMRARIEEAPINVIFFSLFSSVANAETIILATIGTETLSVADNGAIIWDSVPINPGGHYSTETGGYTAPFNGYYQ